MQQIITIDGPSASGKGTTAKQLAQQLNWQWLDSGAFYRAIAYALLQRPDADSFIENSDQLEQFLSTLQIQPQADRIWLNTIDITEHIRTEEISRFCSKIATLKTVRNYLFNVFRQYATDTSAQAGKQTTQTTQTTQQAQASDPQGWIADGRDMGTIVFPDAPLKVYLTASVKARAERRYQQLQQQGKDNTSLEQIEQQIHHRDQQDSNRTHAPLKIPEDALVINNDQLDVATVCQQIIDCHNSPKNKQKVNKR